MSSSFKKLIDDVMGAFLSAKKFKYIETISSDGGGYTACFYESPDCKIKIYRSERDGEVNYLYGRLVTPNSIRDKSATGDCWMLPSEVVPQNDNRTIEEIVKNIPDLAASSDRDSVIEIKNKIQSEYTTVVANL